MWRKAALAALVLCIAALAPGQTRPTGSRTSGSKPIGSKPTGSPPVSEAQDRTVNILRTPNKAQVNKFVCEALEIKHTNPFNIINFFWAVTSREDGGIYSFANPDSNGGYIVVICPEYQLPALRRLAAELDRPNQNSAPGSVYIYHRLKHRNVTDPNFLKAAGYWTGGSGVLWPDVETNSVLIYDAPEGAAAADKAFDEVLDKPLQQVELAVNVYEIDVNNDGTLGLDYQAWKNGPGMLLAQENARGAYFHAAGAPHSNFHASNGGVFLDYPSAFFDALVEKGKAVSLTRTKITAVNRVPAVLTSDEKVIFYQINNTETQRTLTTQVADAAVGGKAFQTDGKTFPVGTARSPFELPNYVKGRVPRIEQPVNAAIKPVDTGVFLTVVPVIGEGMVNMDMNLRMVNHSGYDGTGVPTLNSRQVSNSIAVAPNDEVIFGGLVRERKIQTTQKIPILGSIPVIGYLFGGEITTQKKTVVVAAVQPRLVAGSDNVAATDKDTVAKASGEQVVVLPPSEICFEQNVPRIF